MLKVKINNSLSKSNLKKLDVLKISAFNMYDNSTKHNMKLVSVTYNGDGAENFQEGQQLYIENRIDIENSNQINSSSYYFNNEYTILKVNNNKRLFTFYTDRYYSLTLNNVTVVTDDTTRWYFYFDGIGHLYPLKYSDKNPEIERPCPIYIEYKSVENGKIPNLTPVINCKYENNNVLSCEYNDDTKETLDALQNVIFGESGADISNIRVYRETPLFTEDSIVSIYVDNVVSVLTIPINTQYATNTYQSDIADSSFIEREKSESVNRIIDLEKDVYHPVIWNTSDNNYANGFKKEVDSIVFNLHFRNHSGDNWTTSSDSYWNGCEIDNGNIKLNDKGFFSFENKSEQSDLLSYMGFENSDVRFQKNKLTKSFIRIMFYDSMNPADQNLLYYSTIFINSGELFGKYIKNIETKPYLSFNQDGTINENLTGVKVDREPYGTLIEKLKDDKIEKLTDNEIEELRLSSRFIALDKYQSSINSDGFYLYIWKDNSSTVANDIYMKVEFNHAGYGRTIPFMMPYWDSKKTEYVNGDKVIKKNQKIGIKTFEQIIEDWNEIEGSDMKYGAKKYTKYSYIHFKYKYDYNTNQHIYYLDDEFYGGKVNEGGVYFNENKIILNLYEAKML